MAEEKWSNHVGHLEEGGLHGWCASCPPEERHHAIERTVPGGRLRDGHPSAQLPLERRQSTGQRAPAPGRARGSPVGRAVGEGGPRSRGSPPGTGRVPRVEGYGRRTGIASGRTSRGIPGGVMPDEEVEVTEDNRRVLPDGTVEVRGHWVARARAGRPIDGPIGGDDDRPAPGRTPGPCSGYGRRLPC